MLCAAAMGYSLVAWVAMGRRRRLPPREERHLPPVTVLKPLCGAEPETYEYLRSFCDQRYPNFQLVFGVSDANDPSVAIVRRLQREFPQGDMQLVIDRRQHGSNRKVSNLINMMALARHGVLVLADADVRVTADYLACVVAPLADAGVGMGRPLRCGARCTWPSAVSIPWPTNWPTTTGWAR